MPLLRERKPNKGTPDEPLLEVRGALLDAWNTTGGSIREHAGRELAYSKPIGSLRTCSSLVASEDRQAWRPSERGGSRSVALHMFRLGGQQRLGVCCEPTDLPSTAVTPRGVVALGKSRLLVFS